MTIKRKGRVADGISAAKINEVYLTSHLPASLLRAKIVNLSQNWWHGFHSAIWRVRCDREALIPAVLSHSLTNTSSSLADVISTLERDSVHHPSHTIANRLYVFYGASGALPPLKARKVSESESIFENSPYSEALRQRFQMKKEWKKGITTIFCLSSTCFRTNCLLSLEKPFPSTKKN